MGPILDTTMLDIAISAVSITILLNPKSTIVGGLREPLQQHLAPEANMTSVL